MFSENVYIMTGEQSSSIVAFWYLECKFDVKVFLSCWFENALRFDFNEIQIERYGLKLTGNGYCSIASRIYNVWKNEKNYSETSLNAIRSEVEDVISYIVENPRLSLDRVCVNLLRR